MADLEELAGRFLVDDEVASERLVHLIEKLLPYCFVRKDGRVEITARELSGKVQVKVVLAARLAASKLVGSSVSDEVSAEDISRFTGLPKNQAAARAKECVDEKFAERSVRGSYRARQYKLEGFLSELSAASEAGRHE